MQYKVKMDNSVDTDPSEYAMGDYDIATSTKVTSQEFVTDLVKNNTVVIFSKTKCPHCDTSKTLLTNLGVDYKTIELDQLKDGSEVQATLGEMTSAKTVPRIFINGQCVGGNSDLQTLNSKGVLIDILEKKNLINPQ